MTMQEFFLSVDTFIDSNIHQIAADLISYDEKGFLKDESPVRTVIELMNARIENRDDAIGAALKRIERRCLFYVVNSK